MSRKRQEKAKERLAKQRESGEKQARKGKTRKKGLGKGMVGVGDQGRRGMGGLVKVGVGKARQGGGGVGLARQGRGKGRGSLYLRAGKGEEMEEGRGSRPGQVQGWVYTAREVRGSQSKENHQSSRQGKAMPGKKGEESQAEGWVSKEMQGNGAVE